MNQTTKNLITIGAITATLSGATALYFNSQEQADSFQADLEKMKIEKQKAKSISDYFQGNQDYIDIGAWQDGDLIKAYQESMKPLEDKKTKRTTIGPVMGKIHLIKKLNYILSEYAKTIIEIEPIKK